MRIVGGKDYYDHGLAYGLDPGIVYVRTGRLVRQDDWRKRGGPYPTGGAPAVKPAARNGAETKGDYYSKLTCWKHGGFSYEMESVHVVFCGRYYSGARVHRARTNHSGLSPGVLHGAPPGKNGGNWKHRLYWTSETFWDANSLGRYLAKCGMTLNATTRQGQTPLSRLSNKHSDDNRYRPFARYKLTGPALDVVMEDRVAVATLTEDDIAEFEDRSYSAARRVQDHQWRVDDDTLKDVEFGKVLDPVRAFQELSMWVGGVLPRPGPPMVQITDPKVLLAKAGMDKTSFRKPPEKAR